MVAPRRGAWIEIPFIGAPQCPQNKSLPAGERGLKFDILFAAVDGGDVAPRRGAWIEMTIKRTARMRRVVAPRRGAWIEIPKSYRFI